MLNNKMMAVAMTILETMMKVFPQEHLDFIFCGLLDPGDVVEMRSIKEQGKYVGSEASFGYAKDPKDRHKFVIAEDEASIVRRMFAMYAEGMSTVEIARIFNEEGVKTPAQIWMEKGIRKVKPKGGAFVWQNTSLLRMLKNRAYIGDLVQGTYECEKIPQ